MIDLAPFSALTMSSEKGLKNLFSPTLFLPQHEAALFCYNLKSNIIISGNYSCVPHHLRKLQLYAACWLCLVVPLKSPSQINILVF
ncbi:hypothetical protein DW289_21550 [Escherichia coli]|nr:hypothetical protein DW289_21550 [Escherichia coli]